MPWRRKRQPTPVCFPGKSLQAIQSTQLRESDTASWLNNRGTQVKSDIKTKIVKGLEILWWQAKIQPGWVFNLLIVNSTWSHISHKPEPRTFCLRFGFQSIHSAHSDSLNMMFPLLFFSTWLRAGCHGRGCLPQGEGRQLWGRYSMLRLKDQLCCPLALQNNALKIKGVGPPWWPNG